MLATVAVVFALRAARPVALPLAFALFLIALLWPVQTALRRWLPARLAFAATVVAFGAALWGFAWMLAECVDEAVERWPHYRPRFEELAREWGGRAGAWGLEPGGGDGGQALAWARRGATAIFTVGGGALLAVALTVLGLLEVEAFRDKLTRGLDSPVGGRVVASARQASTRFGRYFGARTAMSAIQGVCTGAFAWAVGLDLALLWAVLSALLNYIPTLGSVLAVVAPGLFSLVQYPELGRALLVTGGLAAVQIVLGNYVDPRLQGRWLSLSPFVVLLSIAFWGWVWGPGGALIAVPVTIGLVIAGHEFPALRPLSVLLSTGRAEDPPP